MKERNFMKMLEAKWEEGKFVCAGLDSELGKIPESVRGTWHHVCEDIPEFNEAIIEATKDIVCAYKPNIAFYEAHGDVGWAALKNTISRIRDLAPEAPVIIDAKRADIGNTNKGYIQAAFEYLKADAITVNPYLGQEALQPFLDMPDKGIIVLCRTSNIGSDEFQNLYTLTIDPRVHHPNIDVDEHWGNLCEDSMRLYERVAHNVTNTWNKNGNCALVVGATYLKELQKVRDIVGDMPILIPGIGAQGGDVEKTVSAGKDSRGQGMIINSSRGIIFASNGPDFAEAARRETIKLHDSINRFR